MKLYGLAVLLRGDCVDLLPRLAATGLRVHATVTDPPYGIEFLGNAWDGAVAHRVETWCAVASVMPPGAHLVSMSADQTYHRLGTALETAGFQPRHCLPWLFATGRCQAQRVAGGDPGHEGLAPRLAPGCELAYLGRLPLETGCSVAENLRRHGVGALRVEAVRSPVSDTDTARLAAATGFTKAGYEHPLNVYGGGMVATTATAKEFAEGGRYPKNVIHDGSPEVEEVFDRLGNRKSPSAREGRVDNPLTSFGSVIGGKPRKGIVGSEGSASRYFPSVPRDEDAFAFEPKPKGAARDAVGGHPTPKPLALMRWYCRLVTCAEGQIVLDPFAGSGTTIRAALDEGLCAVGVELDEVSAGGRTVCTGYCATIARRCPEVYDHVIGRAAAELGLRIAFGEEPASGLAVMPDTWVDDFEAKPLAVLLVRREPAGEATCRDPLGKALGLTLPEHRVPLFRVSLELDLAEDEHLASAPADLGERITALVFWPEVQALLCRRGDLLEDGA